MRTSLAGATGLVIGAMLVGCGSDEPTAAERKAAKARWVQHVDAACRKANTAIADRGWPTDLVDLDRLVVRGIEDVRAAISTISRERVPEGAGPHPGAFVDDLRDLEPQLEKLSAASEDLDPGALVRATDALKPRLVEVQASAKAAGLRDCLTHEERFFIPDAVRAPVFAEELARLERFQLRRIRAIDFRSVSTPAEYAVALDRFAALIDRSLDGIDRLEPPMWALDQTAAYQRALRDVQSAVQAFSAQIEHDRGRSPASIDPATYVRLQRKLARAGKREGKARRKMLRAVGAAPTTPPSAGGGGDATEPESTEQS